MSSQEPLSLDELEIAVNKNIGAFAVYSKIYKEAVRSLLMPGLIKPICDRLGLDFYASELVFVFQDESGVYIPPSPETHDRMAKSIAIANEMMGMVTHENLGDKSIELSPVYKILQKKDPVMGIAVGHWLLPYEKDSDL